MIFNDFLKALGQLDDRAFRSVLLSALGLTLALLVGFVWGASVLFGWLLPDSLTLPFIGEVGFLDEIGRGLGLGAGLILSIFLMIPVASLFIGLFLDRITDAVEEKHYRHLRPAKGAGLWDQIQESLRFLLVLIGLNLLALIAYLIFAPLAPLIFWALNGFLLGREYFLMVALRRMSRSDAQNLRRRNSGQVFAAGLLMAVPLTLPIVNLIVPIVGVAAFTHLFQRVSARAG